MGLPKPTLGYPSRTAALRGLVAEGLTVPEAAARIGISAHAARGLMYVPHPRDTGGPAHQVRPELHRQRPELALNEETLRALRPHAARRDLRTHALARLILEAVVDNDLVDAVLDDREANHA